MEKDSTDTFSVCARGWRGVQVVTCLFCFTFRHVMKSIRQTCAKAMFADADMLPRSNSSLSQIRHCTIFLHLTFDPRAHAHRGSIGLHPSQHPSSLLVILHIVLSVAGDGGRHRTAAAAWPAAAGWSPSGVPLMKIDAECQCTASPIHMADACHRVLQTLLNAYEAERIIDQLHAFSVDEVGADRGALPWSSGLLVPCCSSLSP